MMTLKKTLTTVTLLGSLFAASSVFAHAHLKSQSPAADSTVSAPAELRLVFSEGVEATFTKVTLSKDGSNVPVKSLATEGSDKKTLVVTPQAPLTAGAYKVEWHAVSVDTHKSEGAYSFKVGQ
jgi:methionine-rich copper-binding protein CopC